MTFGIIEIKDSKKSIIGYTESIAEFRNQLEQRYPKAKLHQNLALSDLKANEIFKDDLYLINNDLLFFYVEKLTLLKKGYLYNSTKSTMNIVCQWELIPCNVIEDETVQCCYDLDSLQSDVSDDMELFDSVNEETNATNGSNVPLKRLNLNDMPNYGSINIIGKRGSGKTKIVANLLDGYDSDFIANSLIICPTERMNVFYTDKYPTAKVIYQYDADEIETYLSMTDENGMCVPGAIILDDCLRSKDAFNNDECFRELICNGRHYQKLVVVTMQFPFGLAPELRGCFDYVFLTSEDFFSNQKRAYDHYAGIFPTFDSFRNVLMNVTSDYGSMVLVNRGPSGDFLNKVLWFRASV